MGLINAPINGGLRDVSRDMNETIADTYKRIKQRTKAATSSDESYDNIIKELKSIFEKKNSDYGQSFDLSMDEFGIISSVIRLGDKYNRLKSLTQKEQKVKDESFRDTLMDMANYAIMTVAYMDSKEKGKEDGKD